MATLRGSSNVYDIGNIPPRVNWTVVRGDTASFKVYVTDDAKQPLNIPDWSISMTMKRPDSSVEAGVITDNAVTLFSIEPAANPDDLLGEFTVFLSAAQTKNLQTNDIFDIELSMPGDSLVWTVAQGFMIILEDVTE